MSSSLLHPEPAQLHPQPRTRSTCSRATGTELTLLDLRRLEDLQVEVRELREEVALLEAKLRLQEGGGAKCGTGCGGDLKLEDVSRLPQLFQTDPNPRFQKNSIRGQARPDGRGVPLGLKSEAVELSHCAYATGLKTTTPDASSLSPHCYTQTESRDVGRVNEYCYSDPHPGDAPVSELGAGHPGGMQDPGRLRDPGGLQGRGVKFESVLADCSEGEQGEVKTCSVSLVDCKDMLEVDRIVKKEQEEDVDGYREREFLSSVADVAVQTGLVKRSGPSAPEETVYDAGTISLTRMPMASHFVPDEHLNLELIDSDMCSCFWCGKRFLSPSMLRIHLSTHECTEDGPPAPATSSAKVLQLPVKDKLYPCIHCGKTFTDLSHCKSHEKIHTGEGPYRCSLCGESFAFLYGLQNHQKDHDKEPSSILRPYQCSFCQKKFATRATLIIHRRVHTGERPYKCFFCDQSFTRSDRLKEHVRIHTGEKPYQCNSCGKQFSQSASFRTHQRIHTGEKPYSCSTCGKQFSDLTGLRTHERQHTGERPYHCFQCGKSFAQASNLRAHYKRHEMEQNPLMFSV